VEKMKIVLNLKDLISEGNITEDMPKIVEIPFNKAITLDDLPRSKSALHYHLYYTDVLEKLLKEGLITKEQFEYDADDDGRLYILTLENVEFLNTIIENTYNQKRKVWNSTKKERYKHFLEEFQELWQYKLLSNSN
jgi:hypothetical protein